MCLGIKEHKGISDGKSYVLKFFNKYLIFIIIKSFSINLIFMKKLFLIFLVVAIPFFVFAQRGIYRDIVELKSGNVIKGIIIEEIPNQQIKIQTEDGSLFVFQIDEISKLKKEIITKEQSNPNEDKGYIGLSLGISVPVGDGASNMPTGVTFALVDFGYRFHSNIGITGRWLGSAYSENGVILSTGSLMFGALGVIPISEKVEFIGKALIGFGRAMIEFDGLEGREKIQGDIKFNYDLGMGMKFNLGRKIAFLANFDYIGMEHLNRVDITGTIAYRL